MWMCIMLDETTNALSCGQWGAAHSAPSDNVCSSSSGQQVAKPQQRGLMADNKKHLEWHVEALNNVWWTGAVQLNAALCGGCTAADHWIARVASSCASARCSSTSGPTKSVCISPDRRRPAGHHSPAHPEKNPNSAGGCRATEKAPLVHKAAILNSLTGLFQEANKRGSKCDTVHFVCASANSGAMCPIKSDRRRFVPTWSDIKVSLSSQRGSR